MRQLAGVSAAELERRLEGVAEALAGVLHPEVRRLCETEAVTAAALHHKFLQSAAFTLKFSELSAFFGGLEKQIGSPDPNVLYGMEREHTRSADSDDPFTTPNYAVTTTPSTEWWFVVEPEQQREWPVEGKPPAAPAAPRSALPTQRLESLLREKNAELAAAKADPLLLEEAFGARLYTGPM